MFHDFPWFFPFIAWWFSTSQTVKLPEATRGYPPSGEIFRTESQDSAAMPCPEGVLQWGYISRGLRCSQMDLKKKMEIMWKSKIRHRLQCSALKQICVICVRICDILCIVCIYICVYMYVCINVVMAESSRFAQLKFGHFRSPNHHKRPQAVCYTFVCKIHPYHSHMQNWICYLQVLNTHFYQ